jgi:hypothetical protein
MKLTEFILECEMRISENMVLSAPDKQRIMKQAIRKFAADNPPTAYKTITYGGANYVDLTSDVKKVLWVHPDVSSAAVDTAERYLFGFTPLPKGHQLYFERLQYLQTLSQAGGSRMAWKQVGSKLYLDDVPSDASSLTILYYEALNPDSASLDITDPGDIEWLINYGTALMKIAEGTRLRKASMLGVDTDADSLVSDGKEEKDALEIELADDMLPYPVRRMSGS